ncbi:MAG: hypothetical protein COU26_02725 [Candidatus Levybacteria bacterium CG10_big_fil_rev_8_21_14_0_10_36_30]|nr:MAG: hypothetical protein COU26_02725 [Candidatus Levybacteria bacterium CG10_big_fil_rev_8_21_14_0_10_36_30]
MGYKKRTIKGIWWVGSFRGTTRIITIFKTVLLARLLSPAQFGLFGIASFGLAFLEVLTETGVNVFLVQEKSAIKEHLNEAWLISVVRGLVLCILILISGPFLTFFFNAPEALYLIYLIALIPLIKGFINPAQVIFQKELQFGKEFWFRIIIYGVDTLVSIVVTFITRSPAGIVYGLIAGAVSEAVLSYIYFKLRPKISFSKIKIRLILNRGKWVTIFGIFHYLSQELDNLVIARLLGAGPLGIYQMAFKISVLPVSEITDVISKVTFPVYTKIQNENKRLKKNFIKTSVILSFLVVLSFLFLFIFTKEIVTFILGSAWISTIPILKILALYGAIRGIFGSVSSLFLARGKQKYVAVMTFIRLMTLAIVIVPFVLRWGVIGASVSVLISALAEVPVIIFYTILIFKKGNEKS